MVSFLSHTIAPRLTSFLFTPFYSLNPAFSGSAASLLICFVPRILVGLLAGLVFAKLSKKSTAAVAAAVCGTAVNTILVLGGVALFFGGQLELAISKAIFAWIGGAILTNAIPEMIAAIAVAGAAVGVLTRLRGQLSMNN